MRDRALKMSTEPKPPARDLLGDPAFRAAVLAYVRRRVPPADIEDVVQTVLCDALSAPDRPESPEALKRWLLAIARHKVVDRHRLAGRERPADLPDLPAGPPPVEERSMVRWVERQATRKDDARTLDWMAREGEGEKLEAIAADERVPAARVRQRVSRMRRWMKERWAAELAAVAMLAALAVAAWWLLRDRLTPPSPSRRRPSIVPEQPPSPLDRARALRAEALRACDQGSFRTCLDGLDQARGLDPTGDQDPAVGAARARAEAALEPEAPELKMPIKGDPPAPSAKPAPTTLKLDPSDVSKDGSKKAKEPPTKRRGRGTGKESSFEEPSSVTPGGGGKPSPRKRASSTVLDSPKYGP